MLQEQPLRAIGSKFQGTEDPELACCLRQPSYRELGAAVCNPIRHPLMDKGG